MLRIKRLHTFILEKFLSLLGATYSVCLFIFLMQFLFKYINDMVGKGVGIGVLGEMFFYAALSLTPMVLPLSVLLAALMTFGNLGEHFELLAMKAAGISLIRIMQPLIYLSIAIAGISFVFQNEIVPRAQTKSNTILYSLKQKSPEVDIPERIFYKEISGYNLYVKYKDKKTGMLHDLMIYDYSNGFENAAVIVSDSGKLRVAEDKKSLIMTLHSGESFSNMGARKTMDPNEKVDYRRETFRLREVLISFDTNFNMADESIMGSRDAGKSMSELTQYIDSVRIEQDSIQQLTLPSFKERIYATNNYSSHSMRTTDKKLTTSSLSQQIQYLEQAKSRAENEQSNNYFSSMTNEQTNKQLLLHIAQFYKRYSMALSCILFFFIGAPLGAIIRKGGLGMPAVISVIFYLLYYTVDQFGTKMVKQAVWMPWEGVWLSSILLAALGIFFTYEALNDAAMLNTDTWKTAIREFFKKLRRKLRIIAKK
jgi:lipopolysaccharide export system permease protein